jgi:hypothetical protein
MQEMRNIKTIGAVAALLMLAVSVTAPAKASTIDYHFDFTGAHFAGAGDIFVNSQLDALGGHDILGITGSITGPTSGAITGMIGAASPRGLSFKDAAGQEWIYDNVLHTSGVAFDFDGALFGFGSKYFGNLYSIGTQLYLSVSQPTSLTQPGDPVAFHISPTPLPAALPMFLAGLGGLWFVLRRRRKRVVDTDLDQLLTPA